MRLDDLGKSTTLESNKSPAGDVPVMLAERESDLPLDDGIHQQPHDGEHGQRRHPCGFLQPHRADRGGMLDPATARFHRDMLFLIRLEHLGIRTPFWLHRGGQDRPPVHVLGGDQGLWGHDEAIATSTCGASAFGGRPRRVRFWGTLIASTR